jgi:hypothetical protein
MADIRAGAFMVILRESFGDEVWRAAPAPD